MKTTAQIPLTHPQCPSLASHLGAHWDPRNGLFTHGMGLSLYEIPSNGAMTYESANAGTLKGCGFVWLPGHKEGPDSQRVHTRVSRSQPVGSFLWNVSLVILWMGFPTLSGFGEWQPASGYQKWLPLSRKSERAASAPCWVVLTE